MCTTLMSSVYADSQIAASFCLSARTNLIHYTDMALSPCAKPPQMDWRKLLAPSPESSEGWRRPAAGTR